MSDNIVRMRFLNSRRGREPTKCAVAFTLSTRNASLHTLFVSSVITIFVEIVDLYVTACATPLDQIGQPNIQRDENTITCRQRYQPVGDVRFSLVTERVNIVARRLDDNDDG